MMSVVGGAVRTIGRTVGRAATTTTMAAGAVGGAAVDGVVGAVKGAADGIRRGADTGSHSTPAAALTLGALGVTGLVQWPVLLVVGGAALAWQQLNRNRAGAAASLELATSNGSSNEPADAADSPPRQTKKAPAKAGGGQTAGRSRGSHSHSGS